VDSDFEKLKRFNLAEIFDPTPKEMAQEVKRTLAQPSDNGVPSQEATTRTVSAPSSMDLS